MRSAAARPASPATSRASSRPEAGLDVGGGHADGLGHRAHRVVQPQAGVPDRVPERVGDRGDLGPVLVHEHEVEVAVRRAARAVRGCRRRPARALGAGARRRRRPGAAWAAACRRPRRRAGSPSHASSAATRSSRDSPGRSGRSGTSPPRRRRWNGVGRGGGGPPPRPRQCLGATGRRPRARRCGPARSRRSW